MKKRLLSLLLALVMVLSLLPTVALAEGEPTGHIVMSFELYDPSDNTVVLLKGPVKVAFTGSDTGLDLLNRIDGITPLPVGTSYIDALTIDGVPYTGADIDPVYGAWGLYVNNAVSGDYINGYHPQDGDVYRIVLTTWSMAEPLMYPTMPHDLDALYWAMAEYEGAPSALSAANALVQSGSPTQTAIDDMTSSLCAEGGAHRILTDGRTIQVNASGYPYIYTPTLVADKANSSAGDTVTVTVAVPEGMKLAEGSLRANGTELTGSAGTYTFTMPDCHVAVTARFEIDNSCKLTAAAFSYDEEGMQSIALTPAFDRNTYEYALTVYDFDEAEELYSTLSFEAASGTGAAWNYQMYYDSWFYTNGPVAASGTVTEHASTNVICPGMTNGGQHKVTVTAPGGAVTQDYIFTMTMLPTLAALEIKDAVGFTFDPKTLSQSVIVPNGTKCVTLTATPFDDYEVYLNGGQDDVSDEAQTVALGVDGTAQITLTVDDCGGMMEGPSTTSTYTITLQTEYASAYDKDTKLAEMDALMANIAAANTENSGEWWIMDMAAYAGYKPDTAAKTTDKAKQSFINLSTNMLITGKNTYGSALGDSDFDKMILALTAIGFDPTQIYPVNGNSPYSAVALLNGIETLSASPWTAPYTLAAYNNGSYNSDAREQALLECVLSLQKPDGSWDEWGTIDTTANVLAALAFYKEQPEVQVAINNGVNYLAAQISESGTFDGGYGANANSTAMVVIGLCAAGVDPATDSRFIKNGVSVLDGLLSFALINHSGFGYTNNTEVNPNATEQAFRALIAAAQVLRSGSAYNIYDFSANADLQPARATGADEVSTPTDPTGDDITVYFTIKADTGNYWMNRKAITIPGTDATVYHAFMKALEGSGITQEGAAAGYVRSISKGGVTLSEFGSGINSGWLYKVEGKSYPTVGLTSFDIKNGDSIVFYYTDDWTVDPDAGQWKPILKSEVAGAVASPAAKADAFGTATAEVSKKTMDALIESVNSDSAKAVTIKPEIEGEATKVAVELPKASVSKLASSTDAALTIETDLGKVSISNDALNSIVEQAGGENVSVSVEKAAVADIAPTALSGVDAATLTDAAAVKIDIKSGGKKFTEFGGAALTLALPVSKAHEEGKTYLVLAVSGDGAISRMTGTVTGGRMVVTSTHPATFISTTEVVTHFTDIDGHWAKADIEKVYAKGIMNGVDGGRFDPNGSFSRAMLVTTLWRMEGSPVVNYAMQFTDVAGDSWYSEALRWAASEKLADGCGDGTFAPNAPVTREQFAAILWRYAKHEGVDVSVGENTNILSYDDALGVSGYAVPALQWTCGTGITSGADGKLLPRSGATRAQAATMLVRFSEMAK